MFHSSLKRIHIVTAYLLYAIIWSSIQSNFSSIVYIVNMLGHTFVLHYILFKTEPF